MESAETPLPKPPLSKSRLEQCKLQTTTNVRMLRYLTKLEYHWYCVPADSVQGTMLVLLSLAPV